MRYILIILICTAIFLKSQDFEPNHYLIEWGGLTTDRPLEVDSFNIDGFKLGFQWSGSSQMSNALFHNIIHGAYVPAKDYDSNFTEDMYALRQPSMNLWNMPYIQYEPTLQTSNYKDFITRPFDTTNAVFGFNNIHGTIYDTSYSGNHNYGRLMLFQDSIPNYPADKVVLSDVTPKDKFFTIKKGGQLINYDGTKWNVSINLRRLDTADQVQNDDIVLVIKLPYKAIDTNGDTIESNIKFDYIPKIYSSNTVPLNYLENRGIAQDTYKHEGTQSLDSLVITKRMISTTSSIYLDRTISAHFSCYQKVPSGSNSKYYNPRFKPGFESEDPTEIEDELIDEIDIEVKYYGNCDIAIDWVRIESDKAQQVLRGEYDIADRNSIESMLYSIKNTTKNGEQLMKLHRIYNQDTESDNPTWWGQLRYFNRVTNGMVMTRDYPEPPEAYRYYTKARDIWIGINYDSDDVLMPAPYTRIGYQDGSTMGLKTGYAELADSLSSEMETELRHNEGVNSWEDLLVDTLYEKQLLDDALQARFENKIIENIFNPLRNEFLFADYEWYFYQLLFDMRLKQDSTVHDTDLSVSFSYKRTKTFEEYMLMNYYALMNGCTGFIIDGDNNKNFLDDDTDWEAGNMGLGDFTELTTGRDIYAKEIGDDFINSTYDTWGAHAFSFLNTFADSMRISPDRIYIGTRSMRDALYQFNSYIRGVENELYYLDLVSTLSKGYRLHYLQDTSIYVTDTIVSKFIDFKNNNKVYTTRLYQKSDEDTDLTEPYDSTFFNMTLMKHKDSELDSIFYIGIQNRRTDPLIYFTNPDSTDQKYLKFLSSAEFRDSCMISPDSLLYQDYWWKRLGARKVTVPFNYTYSDTNTYNLLRISEIGSDVDSLNQLWHRGEKYYDMVTDTVIGQNRSLSFNLLPGQGKILKVEVLKSDTVAGFLDNYNQTKLISYEDPTDSNMIRYHLVYHKLSPNPADTTKMRSEVQYIQSMPIEKNSLDENIKWNRGTRRNLSDMFWTESADTVGRYQYPNCNNPSIVVRDSAGTQFAYVVYTCVDSIVANADWARVIYAKINSEFAAVSFNDEIYHTPSNDIYEHGTPVINASSEGNFIAWTDSDVGLLVGYDNLLDKQINKIDTIENTHFALVNPESIKYPSFHSYSHLENGEDNAGLTWYQGFDGTGDIFYSRVKNIDTPPNDTLLHSNIGKFDTLRNSGVPPIATGKAIQLNTGLSFETKPIIFRSLSPYNKSYSNCLTNRFDNINWLSKDNSNQKYAIGSLTFYHTDTNQVNIEWSHSGINFAYSSDSISSINSAQQDGISIGGTYSNIAGDFNLNYTIGSDNIYQEPGYFGSLIMNSDTLLGTEVDYVKNSPTKAAIGENVHLAKSPKLNLNSESNMWKNRRVFETSEVDEYDNPILHSSANLFYKSAFDNKIVKHGLMGFTSDSNNVYFDMPVLEDEPESISSKPNTITAEFDFIDPCITFEFPPARSWVSKFSIEDIQLTDNDNDGDKEMQLTMYGHKNDDIILFLMRNSDSTTMALTTPSSTTYPSYGTKLIYSILDSTGSTFTLIYDKQDTLASFTEKTFLGGLSTDDTVSYKSAIAKDPVKYILDFDSGANFEANNSDLLDFSVYPNPVSNVLTIQAILPEELNGNRLKNTLLELSITDIIGRTILRKTVASGEIVNFDMSNQSNGVYNVKMRYTGSNQFEAVRKIIKK